MRSARVVSSVIRKMSGWRCAPDGARNAATAKSAVMMCALRRSATWQLRIKNLELRIRGHAVMPYFRESVTACDEFLILNSKFLISEEQLDGPLHGPRPARPKHRIASIGVRRRSDLAEIR